MAVRPHADERMVPIDIGLGSAIERLKADFGLDDLELAQALRVDRRTLGRWATGESYPQREARARLQKLARLHLALTMMWRTPESARTWLHRPNLALGRTEPIVFVQAGRLDRVEEALEAINSGFAS